MYFCYKGQGAYFGSVATFEYVCKINYLIFLGIIGEEFKNVSTIRGKVLIYK